ncbi:PP2C family protein-serine/threonine phosphatase [Cryobacterium roopkundense]|uniref:Protein phosphatase n=1 Tax=Cryobacterium roopkundense TaxID=1001240 RepID=A0A7W8ZYH1_9MICO|nr:protein phosphatase 2C domain-containing protein [Cryobacterium roopkundense]MBB5642496.1 protein phosphatase [Cryobacterium roopkundense]
MRKPRRAPAPVREAAPIAVSVGAATDVGLRRQSNEDAYLAQGSLYLVADGMGGHVAGEIASATVISAFTDLSLRPSVTLDRLRETFADAVARVAALPVGAGAGAGTTLTGVAIGSLDQNAYWIVLNLGDSRTYRLSSRVLEQISVDHSVVQELVDSGELTAAQAATNAQRNIVTRSIGAGSRSEPDYWFIPAEPGDRILVCSDGLTGELSDEHIRSILNAEPEPQAAAARLVREALQRGGRDNVTVVVVDALSILGDLEGDETIPRHLTAVADTPPDFDDTIPRDRLTDGVNHL